MSESNLPTRLAQALEFDPLAIKAHWNGIATSDDIDSAKHENARLAPLHRALVECVTALEEYQVTKRDLAGEALASLEKAIKQTEAK